MAASLIRPFYESDIAAVADLHRRMFRVAGQLTPELLSAYRHYFRAVFLEHPWRDTPLNSLVCEEDGRITGFLAVVPRPLRFKGRPKLAALATKLMADPDSRSMAGIRLLQACMQGPQDLTFADEATDLTRRMWETVGGRTAYCHSMRWLSILRPFQLVCRKTPGVARVAGLAGPVTHLLDSAAARLPRSPFARPRAGEVIGLPLDPAQIDSLPGNANAAVVPAYSRDAFDWIWRRISTFGALNGTLQAIRVVSPDGAAAGCFLYHLSPKGVSRVVFFQAQPGRQHDVLAHLFAHAWANGGLAIGGRIPPRCQDAFARARCMLDPQHRWFLVQSRQQELVDAIRSGDAELSSFDGEWSTRFNRHSPSG